MRKRVAVLLVVGVIVTGCGGGSDRPVEIAPSPTPIAYTAGQLEDALPVAADLPAGAKITFRCPSDEKNLCPPESDTTYFSTGGSVDSVSVVGAEQVRQPTSPIDFFAVNVQQNATEAQAKQQLSMQRKASAVYDGSFDVDDKKSADGSTVIGSTGTGGLRNAAVGSWSGYSTARTSRHGDSPRSDKGLLIANVALINGRSQVSAFVSLSAAGRAADAAAALADSLVRDYLARLG